MTTVTDDTAFGEPVVRVMAFNLEVDGGPDEDGRPPQRWRDAHEHILAPRRPDILLRQENTYSHLNGDRRLHAAERALGMRGFLSPNLGGHHPTALFVRPATFDIHEHHPHLTTWRTPPTQVTVRLPEVERDIMLVSWHAAFNSPHQRVLEAEQISALADKVKRGKAFIGGGDCNEYPVPVGEHDTPIDWASPEVTDRVHEVHRTVLGPGGTPVSSTALDRTLLRCGLHDAARHAARHLRPGQADPLQATAGHAPGAAGQGGPSRIDRIYLDAWLAQAVLKVAVIDTSEVSDHHAVEVILSRRKMIEALNHEHDPLPPHALAA